MKSSLHQGNKNLIPDEVVFGYVCYFKEYTQNKSKFQPNTKEGIFVGFSTRQVKLKFKYSTEVAFEEDKSSEYKIKNNHKYDSYFSFIIEHNINNYNKNIENYDKINN
ncbi:hypothetical protein PIROE2DRAFT_12101 [Piromyces sp. E2]|nr:hypothetical protein PIROE2DRAFT_12101 [Piromyces sp. E2]|eukprot:OUM61798.1 hypothetical protein PIROE2DRAFT_12101 [Piromyces sp. E2]